jgi:hypothetical protein
MNRLPEEIETRTKQKAHHAVIALDLFTIF